MAVTYLEITSREPYAGGQAFGQSGAYERLNGRIHFAADPALAANRRIVDLDKAPRDAAGRVHFSADFCLLQPASAQRANRRLLFYVVNRGRQVVPFNRPPAETIPTAALHPGDGFLMRHGWTVTWCGWQWDVIRDPALIGLEAPPALADGKPIQGDVVVQFQPNEAHRDQLLAHWPQSPAPGHPYYQHQPYPAADVDDPQATLTVRDWPDGPRTTIPRERWRFARDQDGGPVRDDNHVWLEGGFQPGKLYEVTYRTRICPVVGTGLLAVRDCVSYLRYADESAGRSPAGSPGNPCAGRIDYAYGYGISQCGRFLREFLYQGMNLDEAGRQVFDGVIPHVAGARRGEFNQRFGQPSVQHVRSLGHLPPFADDERPDPLAAPETAQGLLSRQRAVGGVPKIFTTNSSSEYWRIDCSLVHTDLDGRRDVEPPPEVRVYLLAGTQHGPGVVPQTTLTPYSAAGAHGFNTVDYAPLMRAALVNLDRWASAGEEPPPSAFPRLADGTAARRERVLRRFEELPGVTLPDPERLPVLRRVDLGPQAAGGVLRYPAPAGEPYPSSVSAVDDDGNEIAGIRLPDLTVPLGTHTGWNPRDAHTGAGEQILDMIGSTLPFAPTAEERQRRGDPRPAIQERYGDRAGYLGRVRNAALELAAQRYLLAEDVDLVVALAAERYDAFTRTPTTAEAVVV